MTELHDGWYATGPDDTPPEAELTQEEWEQYLLDTENYYKDMAAGYLGGPAHDEQEDEALAVIRKMLGDAIPF